MLKWYKRWRRIGYRELYNIHFGNEWYKGCARELRHAYEVAGNWHDAYDRERRSRDY